jgi:phosphoglycerol transferase
VESEIYSTSLTQLLLPIPGHRIAKFAFYEQKHQSTTLAAGEVGQHVGLLLAISFVGLLLALLARALRGPTVATRDGRLIGATATGAVISFLFATFGGLNSLIALLISPQIRAWNRLTPFIAFFALVGFVTVADRVARWLRGSGVASAGRRLLAPVVLAAVTVLALWDMTAPNFVPPYQADATTWRSDSRFVVNVERQVPRGSMILQLPFHPFPEAVGSGISADYDLFKGYVHSQNLRWSYGAMKGRSEDWTTEAKTRPLSYVIPAAVAAGFAGIYVDRYAYDDRGVNVERRLRRLLGVAGPLVTSDDNRLSFWDASGLAQRLRAQLPASAVGELGDSLVHPIDVVLAGSISAEEHNATERWNWVGPDGEIDLDNPKPGPRPVVLATTAASSPRSVLRLTVPGQPARTIHFPRRTGKTRLRIRFLAPPGKSTVTLTTVGPNVAPTDPRNLRVQLFSLTVAQDVPAPAIGG